MNKKIRKLTSFFLSLSLVATLFTAFPASAAKPVVSEFMKTASESVELSYNDSATNEKFGNFIYDSANPNKEIKLENGAQLGAGTLTYTFQLDCGGQDCHYRAGMVIAGKTILINALNKGTDTGDWPSANNDGWHVDGYHINYNYTAVKADVTLTVMLNNDGKATSIDCLLIDGQNSQAFGTITLNQPASVDTIKLVSEARGGSGNISLTNFEAKYTRGPQPIETTAKLPVKDESFSNETISGYYSTDVENNINLVAEGGWLIARKYPNSDNKATDIGPSEDAFVITMDKSIEAGKRLEISFLYTNANNEKMTKIQASAGDQTLAISDEVNSSAQTEYKCEFTVPQHYDDWQIVLKVNKSTSDPKIKNVNIKARKENQVSVEVDYSVDNGVSHRVASGVLHGIDYKTPAEYLSDGIYLRALRGQAEHHEIDNNYEYLPGFLYEKTYNRVINRGEDTKLMIGLYYGYKPLANQNGGWQNMAIENGGKYWKDYIHNFMSKYYNEDGTKNRDVYSWIPWNEPDLQWNGLGENFCQAYKNAYDAVKEFDLGERVQGPECSWYESGKMKNFILYCKENNCLPDVLSWHELTPNKMSIAAHCRELYNFMLDNNIEPMEMAITEYQGLGYDETDEGRKKDGNYNTGLAVSYISELENSEEYGLNYGLRSAWGYGGGDPRAKAYLGEMTDIETATMPTGLWYVYNAYKRMTGHKVGVNINNPDNDEAIAALASLSSAVDDKSSTILIGNWNNKNNEYEDAKDVKIILKNIPEYLMADGEVNIKVEQIPETLAVPLYSPTVISDKTYKVIDGKVELDVTELYGRRAMTVSVTTPEVNTKAVNMSNLNYVVTGDMKISTSDGYMSVTGGKVPTYKDDSQTAPESDTTYKDKGDHVSFVVNVDATGQYNLRIKHKTDVENGFMQLYVDGKAVHYPIDLYSATDGEKDVNYGNIYFEAGEHELCFKIVGSGKNKKSSGYTLTFGDMILAKLKDSTVKNVVTFDSAGGKVSQKTMLVKDKAEQIPEVTRDGYTFLGWIDEEGNMFAEGTAVSKSMKVTAQWEQSFTVKLIGNRDICGLTYDEKARKAMLTIDTPEDSEISVRANKENISDQFVYENGKYILKDYAITEDMVFIVNVVESESGTTNPYVKNEAEKYSEQNNIQIEFCDEGGRNVGYIENGSWLKYSNVDFGNTGATKFEARVASAVNGGNIEIHLDSLDGTLIGTLSVTGTGGWQNWVTKSCDIHDVEGIHDLYLKFNGGSGNLFNLNWWMFTRKSAVIPTKEPTATPTQEPTATPTKEPTATPTKEPTATPTQEPTATPTKEPTVTPVPSGTPTSAPTHSSKDNPTVTNTPDTKITPALTLKKLKISAVKCKKGSRKIKGVVSVSKAKVKIKVGTKAYKKATIKGKKFTLKVSRLKKNTKIKIMVTKNGYKKLIKMYKVK